MTSFGYSPGDRVLVFERGRIQRDDLVFHSARGNGGVTLAAPNGKLIRFTSRGMQHACSDMRSPPRIFPKAEQPGMERDCRRDAARELAVSEVFYHSDMLQRERRDVRVGNTQKSREHVAAILAALDQLDESEQRHAG